MTKFPVPLATYRLQFNSQFTFKQAMECVEYFSHLGISHIYASPIIKARKGSLHGYDGVNPEEINPDLGTQEDFIAFVQRLHAYNMGLILDIVPNHMAIGTENPWWMDLLESGCKSKYATYFDIDWYPAKTVFNQKIYLAVLQKPFGKALEDRLILLSYKNGKFFIEYEKTYFPLALESCNSILKPLYEEILKLYSKDHSSIQDLHIMIENLHDFHHLTGQDRESKKILISKQMADFFNTHSQIGELLNNQIEAVNGIKGNPSSFDSLEKLLEEQNYRLCYWKVTQDEINYRRFFDISDYAALRIENNEVFQAVNKKIFEFIQNEWIDGLRIDHIDGLWDPQKYLQDLHQSSPKVISYVVVEKILTGNEALRPEWPIQGSVGYDFINHLNEVFVFQPHKENFFEIYQHFTGVCAASKNIKYECKKLLLNTSLASEVNFLSRKLNLLAEHNRYSQDFTYENLKKGLIEIIACFPVYRSYIRSFGKEIHDEDIQYIQVAIEKAQRMNPFIDSSIYEYIQSVLLLCERESIKDNFKEEFDNFIMHFQQVTGPVMAKGLEDTAFYRFFPLSSLNEVGGDPGKFGINLENFHKKNLERYVHHPHGMLSTTTHDTKRSEDVRARINVLSEIPEQWEKVLKNWSQLNKKHKSLLNNEVVPDNNEEYLIYQTLVGTWPPVALTGNTTQAYIKRIQQFMEKAIKEAKIHSTWIDSNEPYHQYIKNFIENILNPIPENEFYASFGSFFDEIRDFTLLNSLCQCVIKLTSPGVPDIYQGNEMWDFSLVDPDNRRPVNYVLRTDYLKEINKNPQDMEIYKKNPYNGQIKLFVIQKTLKFRQHLYPLFTEGSYIPLNVEGPLHTHVIAFARHYSGKTVIILTCRFFTFLMKDFNNYKNQKTWEGTYVNIPIELSNKTYTELYTQKNFQMKSNISLEEIFANHPFAVLF